MSKSFAKADSIIRDLKDRLEMRGIQANEEKTATGWPRLVDSAATPLWSLEIESADAISKDIFGNDLKAFAPHEARLASVDTQLKADLSKIMLELDKVGVDKLILKEGVDLATAEAAAGTEIIFDIRWPSKGI